MFLATTALEECHDSTGPMLYLGAWCVPWPVRKQRLRAGDVVLPSVWDDRSRFYDAAHYADGCAERLLARLSAYLDDVHAVRRGLAYWRLVLGSWLMSYVHSALDRWTHLHAALTRVPNLTTIVLDRASYVTPRTGMQALHGLIDDPYNLQICSQLLDAMDLRFPARTLDLHAAQGRYQQAAATRRPARLLRARHAIDRLLAPRLGARVGISGVNLRWAERWQIAVRTRGDVVPMPAIDTEKVGNTAPVFDRRRLGLGSLDASDRFEHAVVRSLPVNFPAVYLEGHESASAAARSALKHVHVDAMVSETDWYAHDAARYVAAEAAVGGTKMVPVQHGAGYGMSRFSPGELHERRLADRFLVWGWADGQPLRNWPSALLSGIADATARRPDPSDRLLFVATSQSRYLHVFNSQPAGTQMEEYFGWQARFVRTLPEDVRRVVAVRTYPYDFGQAAWSRLEEQFDGITQDGEAAFARSMRQSRLLVIDHCGTSVLETLVADVPVVLFWNPARWELRTSAEPFFDELRRVGVLYDDPESAAQAVAHLYGRAAAWWQGDDVRAARARIVDRFALHRRGGAMSWATGLADAVTCA